MQWEALAIANVFVCLCVCLRMCICVYACLFVCIHVYMCVCLYLRIFRILNEEFTQVSASLESVFEITLGCLL